MVCGQGGLYGICIGGREFGGLRLQGQPGGFSVRNTFEDSCTEELMVEVKAIFEGGFNFAASESRKKSDSTNSEFQREEDRYAYPSTQEHQKLEGKLKHRV